MNLRVTKLNRTAFSIKGTFLSKSDVDDTVVAKLYFFGMSGNEYRKIHEAVVPKFCTEISTTKLVYPDLVKASNLPPQSDKMCPIKPGSWEIKSFIFENKVPSRILLGIKKWKIVAEMYKNDVLVLVEAFYAVISN